MEKIVYLVGIGMGSEDTITGQGIKAIRKADILIGANRMLEIAETYVDKQQTTIVSSYIPEEIGKYLRRKEFHKAVVVLSGDVGFYSGAKKLIKELSDFSVELVPGITSMVYFCSKLKIPWEDVCFGSAHGKKINFIQRIVRHNKCFFLLDGKESLDDLCDKLLYYGLGHVRIHIGERLSYFDEKIVSGSLAEIKELQVGNLLVVLIENEKVTKQLPSAIPDSEFIRSNVPMTKSEIRTISIGKLQLTKDAVVYDVGAGSGSVSIEIAMQAPDIQVYAVEKKEDALELLQHNKRKFAADNMEIISGMAPEVLTSLPAPTHAFIGGSSGNLEEILICIFEKNPRCRVVVNIIALNSIGEVVQILENHGEYDGEIIQVQTSVARQAGRYHLMMGQNPIYIVTIWKK